MWSGRGRAGGDGAGGTARAGRATTTRLMCTWTGGATGGAADPGAGPCGTAGPPEARRLATGPAPGVAASGASTRAPATVTVVTEDDLPRRLATADDPAAAASPAGPSRKVAAPGSPTTSIRSCTPARPRARSSGRMCRRASSATSGHVTCATGCGATIPPTSSGLAGSRSGAWAWTFSGTTRGGPAGRGRLPSPRRQPAQVVREPVPARQRPRPVRIRRMAQTRSSSVPTRRPSAAPAPPLAGAVPRRAARCAARTREAGVPPGRCPAPGRPRVARTGPRPAGCRGSARAQAPPARRGRTGRPRRRARSAAGRGQPVA